MKLKITGNAETVGYAIDNIKDKKIRVPLGSYSTEFTSYDVKTIQLKNTKKDPYQLVGILEIKTSQIDFDLLKVAIKNTYSTLEVV